MSLPEPLRTLNVSLPACPSALARLGALLDDGQARVDDLASVIEHDMALASAVVRTVNSAMFGLLHRVQTVAEAVLYLGTAEVAGITYATALKGAFTPTPAMNALWDRSMRCGLLMGRSASLLGLDGWRAHTAGLFAHSGQALLLHHLPHSYGPLMERLAGDRAGLLAQERLMYGATHAALGSALCASWGLAPEVVKFVRRRIDAPASWMGLPAPLRDLLGLGTLVDAAIDGAEDLTEAATRLHGDQEAPRWVDAVERPMRRLREATAA